MSTYFQLKSSIAHWLDRVDDHSIHSPFYFDFYNTVIKGQNDSKRFDRIEETRSQLLNNHGHIQVNDLGAKSNHFSGSNREIAEVASTSLAPKEYCELYYRIAKYLEAERILELGTSLGITSLYLSATENSSVFTFEGNPAIIDLAKTNFKDFKRDNLKLIEGNLDSTLSDFLQDPTKIDFVLMDANHRLEPTLRYYHLLAKRMSDNGIIVVDDIHLSAEMTSAWNQMRNHDLVYGSIDLYKCGILLFDLGLTKQHFVWSL